MEVENNFVEDCNIELFKYKYSTASLKSPKWFFSSLNRKLNNYDVSSDVGVVINILENLKKDDLFLDDSMIFLIEDIYKICYLYMKLDFLYNHSSMLFDYFKSNYHDFWYINEFVKADILELENSLNSVLGINELMVNVNECRCDENDNFMNEDLLKSLAVCSYPNEAREFYLHKVILYIEELQNVSLRLNDIFGGVSLIVEKL